MSGGSSDTIRDSDVVIPCGKRLLRGVFSIPANPWAVIIFAHGSGSGRKSERNQFVAGKLQRAGLATLLLDLLEPDEAEDRRRVFDIELLAASLNGSIEWLDKDRDLNSLPKGYFGASTGAAAALLDDALRPGRVGAIVSRGGRPDLAGEALRLVQAPTLLIVGGADTDVLKLNRSAMEQMVCDKELTVIPGATHLFPEPGALEQVAALAEAWFQRQLGRSENRTGEL